MTIDRIAISAEFIVSYFKSQHFVLATAESCTAGTVVSMLSDIEGCGAFLDCGYVTYSSEAKQRLLGVRSSTIEKFTLTSEEVAREMAVGALENSAANAAVATTGVAGPEPMDGIPSGVVCIAWAFRKASSGDLAIFSKTIHLQGDRQQIRKEASNVAINGIIHFHQQPLEGNVR